MIKVESWTTEQPQSKDNYPVPNHRCISRFRFVRFGGGRGRGPGGGLFVELPSQEKSDARGAL